MEDQGKRLLLAAALAMGVFLAWNYLFPQPEPARKPAPTEAAKPAVQGSPAGQPAPVAAAPGAAPGAAAPGAQPEAAPRGPEQTITLSNGVVDAVFTSWGGGLKSWRLLDKKYETSPHRGELMAQPEGGDQVASLAVSFLESAVVPLHAEWAGEKVSDHEVRYRYESAQIEVTKTFTFYPSQYLLRLVVSIEARGADSQQRVVVSTYGYQDPKIDTKGGMGRTPREWKASCFVNDEVKEATSKDLQDNKGRSHSGAVAWGGFTHPYLLIASAPKAVPGESLACSQYPVPGKPGLMQTDLVWSPTILKAGDAPVTREVVTYIGPKFYSKLEASTPTAGYDTHFEKAMDLGWFAFLGRPLLWLLLQFYGLVGNWGIAIILLTFLVKLATLYWTQKSMRSMQAMSDLKPKIDELQKKYADDRQRMQTEMMALYKTHGVNPLAGCLPILLQMPVWLALYRMLSAAGELYQAQFIPGWIRDLTDTDPYHILPIVLIVAMFGQAKLSPAAVDSAQQKILMYGMPLVFGVMGFFFPSGLSLYILTNTVLSAIHTLYMKKTKKPAPATAPAGGPAEVAPAETAGASKASSGGGASGKNAGKRRRK
jgi:YidC/Oxa1 family membrane protein insertase